MLKIFISNVMFPKDSFTSPFLQLINALEVARNGRPKITGNELHASTGLCIQDNKIHRVNEFIDLY
jgi:hypothetical protein